MKGTIEMERIIFRTERNPYTKETNYIAVFPDSTSQSGRLLALPFSVRPDYTIFESHCEIDYGYYLDKTRIVHKSNKIISDLLNRVQKYHRGAQYEVVEKITKRKV